ncbi:MAG: NAD(P)/FAD-dependent oxidoreductase [Deltaproteobacteria bacterium]|nr:NAD(P)/FAD-dependent oxidoreductase [Deltaproteobacteria bacterium]
MQRSTDIYDTIIIGGGLAGLSCAALLVKSGQKVVLLEKNWQLGGYATSYEVKGHRFDIAIQAIGGCDPDGAVYRLLDTLNIKHKVRFLQCEPARIYYFDESNTPWEQSGFLESLIQSLCSRFPDYKNAIIKCYEMFSGIMTELGNIADPDSSMAAFGFTKSYPLLAAYGDYTVKQFLDELNMPEALQDLITARSGYCMLKPDQLSMIGYACTEMTYSQGAWMVEGGIKSLVNAIGESILENGGRIEKRTKAIRIQTKDGCVDSVATQDGKMLTAKQVVVAAAVGPALEKWLDSPHLLSDRYRKKLAVMKPTGSYYIAYYRTHTETVKGLRPNIEVRFDETKETNPWVSGVYYLMIPSLVDSSAAPPDSHCLCLSVPCPPGVQLSAVDRRACRTFLEAKTADRFPQLKGKLDYLFELGPVNLAAMSGNPMGSAYGWAHIPKQSGIKRLNIKTPVPGLYLAGHWSMPGGGIPGVMTSGQLCAQAILNDTLN